MPTVVRFGILITVLNLVGWVVSAMRMKEWTYYDNAISKPTLMACVVIAALFVNVLFLLCLICYGEEATEEDEENE